MYSKNNLEQGVYRDQEDGMSNMEMKLNSEDFLKIIELGLPPVDGQKIEEATREIMTAVVEDPTREGLLNTPNRVARMYGELLDGYRTDPVKLINGAVFDVEYDDMVIVKDIEFSSLCEHHMLPFLGHAHVAYIPRGKVIGLSKIPRIVDMFAHRLQVQERMTRQIANFLSEILDARGVAVVVEGKHMCSMMRGVQKHDSSMTTSAMLGAFRERESTRNEFMAHLGRTSRNFGI
jgi:GTP cyclohydrolase I